MAPVRPSPRQRHPSSPLTASLNIDLDQPDINPLVHDLLCRYIYYFSHLDDSQTRKTPRCLALLKSAAVDLVRHFKVRVVISHTDPYTDDILHTRLTEAIYKYLCRRLPPREVSRTHKARRAGGKWEFGMGFAPEGGVSASYALQCTGRQPLHVTHPPPTAAQKRRAAAALTRRPPKPLPLPTRDLFNSDSPARLPLRPSYFFSPTKSTTESSLSPTSTPTKTTSLSVGVTCLVPGTHLSTPKERHSLVLEDPEPSPSAVDVEPRRTRSGRMLDPGFAGQIWPSSA